MAQPRCIRLAGNAPARLESIEMTGCLPWSVSAQLLQWRRTLCFNPFYQYLLTHPAVYCQQGHGQSSEVSLSLIELFRQAGDASSFGSFCSWCFAIYMAAVGPAVRPPCSALV